MLVQKGLHLPKVEELANCPLIPRERILLAPEGGSEEERRKLWLEDRKKRLGASDSPIIMGTSKYKSKFTLWHEKMGLTESDKDESIRQMCGNELEDGTARIFTRVNPGVGYVSNPENAGIVHNLFPYNVASIDRFLFLKHLDDIADAISPCITRNPFWVPIEIKMVDSMMKREWDNFEIPQMYYDQVQNQLDCCGRPVAVLMALFGGNDPVVWTVWRDMQRCQEIGDAIQAFKLSMERNEAPPPDDSESTKKTLGKVFPIARPGLTMPLTEAARKEALVKIECEKRLEKTLEVKSKLESRIVLATNRIRAEMGETETMVGDDLKLSWKNQDAKEKDKDAIAKDPEYVAGKTMVQRAEARYTTKKTTRVLRVVEVAPKK